jgi:hypothetical protein
MKLHKATASATYMNCWLRPRNSGPTVAAGASGSWKVAVTLLAVMFMLL